MFRRERDTRRVVKSTRDHAETMGALSRAAEYNVGGNVTSSRAYQYKREGGVNTGPRMIESYPTYAALWRKPESVRKVNPIRGASKNGGREQLHNMDLLTTGEVVMGKYEDALNKGPEADTFHTYTMSKKESKDLDKRIKKVTKQAKKEKK